MKLEQLINEFESTGDNVASIPSIGGIYRYTEDFVQFLAEKLAKLQELRYLAAALVFKISDMTILLTKEQKANKIHICNFCEGKIAKGEVYSSQRIVDGGDIYTFTSHVDCMALLDFIDVEDQGDGIDSHEFQTTCREYAINYLGIVSLDEPFEVIRKVLIEHFLNKQL